MSQAMSTKSQTAAKQGAAPAHTPAPHGLVQRSCACGGQAGLDGECDECRRARLVGEGAPLVQAKLTVSRPGDRYEQEADRIADTVMRMRAPAIQRETRPEEEDEDEQLQMKSLASQITPRVQRETRPEEDDEDEEEPLQAKGPATPALTPAVEAGIQAVRHGGGQPLDPAARAFMEPRLGHGFGQVRVHAGPRAEAAARSVGARAFTVGRDVVFGAGEYAPGTSEGRRLLAHELVHTVQQDALSRFQIQRVPKRKKRSKRSRSSPASSEIPIPWFKGHRESLALLVSSTFPEELSYEQALELTNEIAVGETFAVGEPGARKSTTEQEFAASVEPIRQFNVTRQTYEILAQHVAEKLGLSGIDVIQRFDQILASLTAASEFNIPQSVGGNTNNAKLVSAAEIAIITALGAGTSEYIKAGEIDSSEDLRIGVRNFASDTLRVYFGLNEQVAKMRADDLIQHVPESDQLQARGIKSLVVVADVGRIYAYLLVMRVIDEDSDIPGKGMPSASSIQEAALLNSLGEFFETLSMVVDAPATGAVAGVAKSKVKKEATKQSTKKAAKAAEKRARRKAERALKRHKELQKVLTDPEVRVAARKLMSTKISDYPRLVEIWEDARKVTRIEDVARTTENTRWARYRARNAFNNHRREFWERVARDDEAKAIFERAGFTFDGAAGTAPTFKGLPGKAGRMSLDHRPARIKDDPFKALDPTNLRFGTEEENTFLEVLKSHLQKHESRFGGHFE